MPDTAERIHHGDMTEIISVSSLKNGDLVLVRPSASIPADGDVTDGHSNVNEFMITVSLFPFIK